MNLDWFPLACDALADPKLRRPRQEFGYLAIVVYLELLCILYRDKGYYILYDEETRDDVIWTVINEALSGKYQPDAKTIGNLIDRLAACRLFSHDLYERGFITSHRAQEQYYRGMVGRADARVNYDIWLLDQSEMKAISSDNPILRNFISRPETTVSRPDNMVFDAESTHRKGEDRREKDIIEYDTIGADNALAPIRETFKKEFGLEPDTGVLAAARKLLEEGRPAQQLAEAVELAAERHRRSAKGNIFSYTVTLMRKHRPSQPVIKPAADASPSGLTDWELEWLDAVRQYKAKHDTAELEDNGCQEQEDVQGHDD